LAPAKILILSTAAAPEYRKKNPPLVESVTYKNLLPVRVVPICVKVGTLVISEVID
jgi:hypothetical protein